EVALAEIEHQEVLQHQEEALVSWFVETELLLQLLDKLGIETLGAAIFRGGGVDRRAALSAAAAEVTALPGTRNARACPGVRAGKLGDNPLHRSSRRKLHHDERHEHDAEQRRDHEQQAA